MQDPQEKEKVEEISGKKKTNNEGDGAEEEKSEGEVKTHLPNGRGCTEEGEKNTEDIVENFFQAIAASKKCMEVHADYYDLILQAEKAVEEEAAKELEKKERLYSKEDGGGRIWVRKRRKLLMGLSKRKGLDLGELRRSSCLDSYVDFTYRRMLLR